MHGNCCSLWHGNRPCCRGWGCWPLITARHGIYYSYYLLLWQLCHFNLDSGAVRSKLANFARYRTSVYRKKWPCVCTFFFSDFESITQIYMLMFTPITRLKYFGSPWLVKPHCSKTQFITLIAGVPFYFPGRAGVYCRTHPSPLCTALYTAAIRPWAHTHSLAQAPLTHYNLSDHFTTVDSIDPWQWKTEEWW